VEWVHLAQYSNRMLWISNEHLDSLKRE